MARCDAITTLLKEGITLGRQDVRYALDMFAWLASSPRTANITGNTNAGEYTVVKSVAMSVPQKEENTSGELIRQSQK